MQFLAGPHCTKNFKCGLGAKIHICVHIYGAVCCALSWLVWGVHCMVQSMPGEAFWSAVQYFVMVYRDIHGMEIGLLTQPTCGCGPCQHLT